MFMLLNPDDECEGPEGVPEVWAKLVELSATDEKVAAFLVMFGPWAEEWTKSRLNS